MRTKIILIALLMILATSGAGCLSTSSLGDTGNQGRSDEISEEERARLAEVQRQYTEDMRTLCSTPIPSATARDYYKCKDYDGGMPIEYYLTGTISDIEPDLPAYCDRKLIELSLQELAECHEDEE